MRRLLLSAVLLILVLNQLFSVPAYPYPVKYKQPDGSFITLQLKGDERVHWAETSDGYTLLSNGKNGWEYAVKDNSGNLKTSGVLAKEVGQRTSTETKLINNLPKKLRFSVSQENILKSVWETKVGSEKLVGTGSFFDSTPKSHKSVDGRQKVFSPNGTKKLILIMIQYTDVHFTFTRQDFVDLMNTQNYNANGAQGCVRDFFYEMSYGQFIVETDVAPNIYTADYDMAYYGAHSASGDDDIRAGDLMKEAVEKADADVDFTQYDNDGDGAVDGVYIIYAGYGEATSLIANTIWPHAGSISGETFDGERITKYSCSNELNADGTLTSIGVICHEFGHVCGAPDYYDTDYADGGSYTGTGYWDLMATGVYNGTKSGSQPAHFNPFEKIRAGWLTPITLTTPTKITNMPDITTTPVVYKYNTNTDGEYYLMENRQQTGFNTDCPGHGLMIYHYSKSYWNASANKTAPQGFYPVCASSGYSPTTTSDKSTYGSINSGGCPFPGTSAKDSFTDATTPTAKDWGGNNTLKPITTISESNGLITFTFISVPSINPILSFDAKVASSSQINLTWTNNSAGNSVIIARNTSATFGTPVSGTTYTPGTALSGGGEIIYSGSAESFDDTGLSASTPYYYQIWATNGTNYSEPATISASTACSSVSMPLFSEGFESGVSSCWEQEHILNEKDWAFQTGGYTGNHGPSTAHTGTKNACLYSDGWTSYTTKLITPPLDLSSAAKPVLKFWHTQTYWAGQDILRVYYRTSLTDTWKQLTIYTNSITSWTLETIDLPNPSSTYYIAFEANANYGYGVCLDDIEVWKDGGDNQWTGATSTDWFTASNWSTGVVPTSTNNVEIPSGTPYSPVISATGAACQNIIIDNGATLTMNNSTAYTLTVTGDWTNNGTFAYGVGTVSFEGTNSLQTIGGSSTSSFYILQVKKGNADNILEVTSPIELKASLGYSSPLNLVSGTFKLSANSTITPFTNQTSIVENCAIWNNGGTIELSNRDMLVRGLFKQTNGTSNFKRLQYRLTNGVIDIQGGTVNISRALSSYTSGEKVSFKMSGGVININPTTSTTSTDVPFLLSLTSTFSMSGGTICIANSLATASADAGGDFQNFAGTYTVTGGTIQIGNASTTGSPVIRINSTVPAYNLVLNATGTPTAKLVTNNLSVNNDVTLGLGTKLDLNSLNLSLTGNWINNGGTLTATPTGTVLLTGTSAQTLGGTSSTIFNNLTQNNTNGTTLNGVDASINGTLTLSTGVISTGSNKLIIANSGSVSRTSGHIYGYLQKNVGIGTNVSKTFEIGDAVETQYKPVSVTFDNVSTAGNLTGKTTSGDNPQIGSSSLDIYKSLNRYWTLTNNGTAFGSYNAVFTFSPDELDASANVSNFAAGKYNSSASSWEYPTVSSISSSSATLSGLTSFSDFAFAEQQVVTGFNHDSKEQVFIYTNRDNQIVLNVSDYAKGYDVSVYGVTGQLLINKKYNAPIAIINTKLNTGVYFVTIKIGEQVISKKVIIKKSEL